MRYSIVILCYLGACVCGKKVGRHEQTIHRNCMKVFCYYGVTTTHVSCSRSMQESVCISLWPIWGYQSANFMPFPPCFSFNWALYNANAIYIYIVFVLAFDASCAIEAYWSWLTVATNSCVLPVLTQISQSFHVALFIRKGDKGASTATKNRIIGFSRCKSLTLLVTEAHRRCEICRKKGQPWKEKQPALNSVRTSLCKHM